MSRSRQRCALAASLFLSLVVAQAQPTFSGEASVGSVSGQFLVSDRADDAPLFRSQQVATNTSVVRLESALLAVSAERFKIALWRQLGLASDAPWAGKIYLRLHPAFSLDETVTIASVPFLNGWNYEVELPDLLLKTRFARALSGVLLLELANRSTHPGGHTAELPAWLVDGLAQQVLATDGDKVVLSAPWARGGGVPLGRINAPEHDFDPLAIPRHVLQTLPALTFDQLSWPTDAQMNGADGGVYFASAQLFQAELLGLPNGPQKMRDLLSQLPAYFNWQTAFFHAFGGDFQRPLDVEKWWALRVINFASRAPGPRWTTDLSLARLQGVLSVPVQFRDDSNALPAYAEISLQDALKSLPAAEQEQVLRTKVRDLTLVELRLAPPFGGLADGYRTTLADFLGDPRKPAPKPEIRKHGAAMVHKAGLAVTLKKLDALDRQRRNAEATSVIPLPGSSAPAPDAGSAP